jgi:dihydrofolate reductase
MTISLVVAATENNVIGKDNQLLWHLPNDLKFFKNTTWGMPVIMGRKTFESLNRKPLNGRFNIIITSHKDLAATEGEIRIASSTDESIKLAEQTDCKEAFVIGGGEIFKTFMPSADKIFMTRVHTSLEGDTFFPTIDEKEWKLKSNIDFEADEKHKYPYSFQVWERSSK